MSAQPATETGLAPRALLLQLAVSLAAAALCALLLSLFWGHQSLPDRPLFGAAAAQARPGGLALFAVAGLPAVVFLPTLALVVVLFLLPPQRRRAAPQLVREVVRGDAVTYLFLPAMLVLPFLWRQLGEGFLALGLVYLGALSVKAALLGRLVWGALLSPPGRVPGRLGLRGQAAVFVAVWVVLGLAAAWVNQAAPAAPREVGRLLALEELAADAGPGEPAGDGQPPAWLAGAGPAAPESPGLTELVLLPGYGLAGRLGALALLAAFLALMAGQLVAWLEECGAQPGPAAATAGLVLLSAPVLALGQQAAAAAPAMLAWVAGLRCLRGLGSRPWAAGPGLAAAAAGLGALGAEYLAPAGGLAVAAGLLLARRRRGPGAEALMGLAAAVAAAGLLWLLPQAELWRQAAARLVGEGGASRGGLAAAALLLDQARGLLWAAPVWLVALAGLPAALKDRPRASLEALLPLGLYLLFAAAALGRDWPAGGEAPAGHLAVALPAASLFLAVAVQRLGRRGWRLLWLVPAAAGVAYCWLLTLLPWLRFAAPGEPNPLVLAVGENLRLSLHHLLPSAYRLGAAWWLWALGLAAAWVVLAAAVLSGKGRARPGDRPGPAEALAVPLVLGAAALALGVAAGLLPPRAVEAEGLAGEASLAAPLAPGRGGGRVLRPGQAVRGRLELPAGPVELVLVGRAPSGGTVAVLLEGRRYEQPWPAGRPRVSIDLGAPGAGGYQLTVVWLNCPSPGCRLFLDRLEVVPAAPAPAGG